MTATVSWNRLGNARWVAIVLSGMLALAGGAARLELAGASAPAAGAQAHALTGRGLSLLPVTARGPVSAALGARERSYWVYGLRASNRAQRLGLLFSPTGVRIGSRAGWVRLSVAAVGRPGHLAAVASAAPAVHLNRVTYARGAVREWYVNGPGGLEQGFDLARAPAGSGPVVLSLALRGDLRARMEGDSVNFGGERGLRYGDLSVTDATGRRLPALLSTFGSHLRISIDAAGARYPLRVDPMMQEAELSPPSGAGPTEFGASVAVSGDTIAVGDPGYDTSGNGDQIGAIFVFEQHGGSWDTTPDATLTASDANAGSQLGGSVAISGNAIVAGAIGHGSSPGEGSVYVFVEPSGGWTSRTQTAELNTDVGEAGDNIGASVGISGNAVVAGAPLFGNNLYNGTGGDSDGSGAAFVWVEPSTGWVNMHTQTGELTSSDGADGDKFGSSVGISGGEIAVGAPYKTLANTQKLTEQGAAYVFDEPAQGWANMMQTAELQASDSTGYDTLGNSVAISGNRLVAGAPGHTNPEGNGYHSQGAIYVFGLPTTGTVQEGATVTLPSTSIYQESLGSSVAFAGSDLIASQPEDGATYEFPGLDGSNNAIGPPPDASSNEYNVDSVAIDGATAVYGESNIYENTQPGNAYVYPSGGSASGPSVATGAATAVTSTTAALNATIGAGSTDTNYMFEYGTSAALGSTLPAVGQFGAGTGATAITQHPQELSGLSAGTTYYYKACATNVVTGATPLCGSVQSFKTSGTISPPPKPPTPSVGKSSVSGTTASVPVGCSGTSGSCSVTITLSVTETLSGGKVTGVSASASKKKKPKKTKKTVTVGKESIKLAAGKHETVKVSLNGTGKSLLKKHPKLSVQLLVTVGGKKLKSTTVTFKAKKAKHKK